MPRSDLLAVPEGQITESGVRHNIDVAVQYTEAWLSGNGCVPIYNLMEDAATAEISRSQLWQWVHHGNARLSDGRLVDAELMQRFLDEGLAKLRERVGEARFAAGNYARAKALIERLVMQPTFNEFLTVTGYDELD